MQTVPLGGICGFFRGTGVQAADLNSAGPRYPSNLD